MTAGVEDVTVVTDTAGMTNTTHTPQDNSLLDDIGAFLDRFVAFSQPEHRTVLSLWVLHTWAFDGSYSTPYIYVSSAEKQSGKTRLIETLAYLVRNQVVASQVSASSLFRAIETQRPTLLIDEVDAIWSGAANEDLRGILNSGYKHNGQVMRVVSTSPDDDTGGVRYFSTFSPKLLAGIDNGKLPDTIADRSINIVLKRKKQDVSVERMIDRKVAPVAEELKKRCQDWASKNQDKILSFEPKEIDEISDRAFEISEPLLQVASVFKGATKPAREALIALLKKEENFLSVGGQILAAAKSILDETGADRLSSAALADALQMSAKQISVILKPYGITPGTIRLGNNTTKGYYARDFVDAFERYLYAND